MLAIVLRAAKVDSVRTLAPAVRYAGSLVESIDAAEAGRLRAQIARAAGVDGATTLRWQAVDAPESDAAARTDSLSELSTLLARLAELPGPSGHERLVRDAVRAAMPSWARERVETDSAGNLVLTMGPSGKATVFLAHLDEVGYEVRSIAPDGIVTLAPLGGLVASAWEGQPALIHVDSGMGRAPLPGVFVPRDDPQTRRPRQLTAWFGMDSTALAALGVKPGLGVTSPKDALRIGASRFTSRALDDRAGTTALLMALRRVDPGKLDHRVVFAWTTGEEVGLVGATALAARMKTSVERVYSIDTFVSSDTPLESPHFAYAPLGAGPVLRLAENTGMAPLDARKRVERIAHEAGVPVQIGLTQGGTDGTAFTFWGAPNVGLSWPGRYSHSPAEVLDLTDLRRLVDLIVAVASESR
jgi:putative aminopeptidase FrvX